MTRKFRNVCFTGWKNEEHYKSVFAEYSDVISYMIFKAEKCPKTGKRHIQGYCEFFKQISGITKIQKIFNESLHIEARKGQAFEAIMYVKKEETSDGEIIELGERNKQQGHRSDLDAIYEDIASGMTPREILFSHGGGAVKYINMISRCCSLFWNLDKTNGDIETRRKIMKSTIKNCFPSMNFKEFFNSYIETEKIDNGF